MLGQSYDIIFLKSVNVFSILLKMAHLLLVWKSSWKCGNGSGLRHKDVDNKGNLRTQRFPYKTPSKPKQTKDGWTQGTPPHSDDPWVAFFSNVGLAGWMTEWLTDWMTEALTDWLAGLAASAFYVHCLCHNFNFPNGYRSCSRRRSGSNSNDNKNKTGWQKG